MATKLYIFIRFIREKNFFFTHIFAYLNIFHLISNWIFLGIFHVLGSKLNVLHNFRLYNSQINYQNYSTLYTSIIINQIDADHRDRIVIVR